MVLDLLCVYVGIFNAVPSVENTTWPLRSVRYTEILAADNLVRAAEVGWP